MIKRVKWASLMLLAALLLMVVPLSAHADVIFVDASAPGGGDGVSWATAYNDLQLALGSASAGDEIWVAAGIYKPTTTTDRSAVFQLVDNVAVYGGFAGDETAVDQRDLATYTTILSGDIGDVGTAGDNSYHVVDGSGSASTAVLDGFTVMDGYANGSENDACGGGMINIIGSPTLGNLVVENNYAYANGGGMYNCSSSSPTLTDVVFTENSTVWSGGGGGGIANSENSNPTLTNVSLSNNEATNGFGGGMFSYHSDPTLTNVNFWGNSAEYGGGMYGNTSNATLTNVVFSNNSFVTWGGGMYNRNGSNPTLTNVVFWNNTSVSGGSRGGGMYNRNSSSPALTNVTFSNNSANIGGGMFNEESDPTLINTILWNNLAGSSGNEIYNYASTPVISYSLIAGSGGSESWDTGLGTDGGNNIDADPLFVDMEFANLRLRATSPAVNTGNDAAPNLPVTDLAGNSRIICIAVDMGAYERQCPPGPVIYVDTDTPPCDHDGTSWDLAFVDLQEALEWAQCDDVTEIWVAAGEYYPTEGDDRSAAFQLVNGVAVYGGFLGIETVRSERDSLGNTTVLSGDIGTKLNDSDNAYHVVVGSGTNSTAVLDGFKITGGRADGYGADGHGGGMYNLGGHPAIANVTFSDNYAAVGGGGMMNESGSPMIVNVIFSDNYTYSWGGGMYNYNGSNPTLVNVMFTGNTASDYSGGGAGLLNSTSDPTLINVTIVNNSSDNGHGGGMYDYNSNPVLVNTVIWGNTASRGVNPQVYNTGSVPEISFSDIGGCGGSGAEWDGYVGNDNGGNIDADPMFIDESNDKYVLFFTSPAINAGANESVPAGITKDLAGNDRIAFDIVDMGAYETQNACPPGTVLYVDAAASGNNDGTSWDDAIQDLQWALELAPLCPGVTDIWVAEGTYRPTSNEDRTATFGLLNGVGIYGGFLGIETERSERDFLSNVTVLSGDIGAAGDSTDNSYHVVTAIGTDETAVLDGFTITGGNADASVTFSSLALSAAFGGGTDLKPTLSGEVVAGSRIDAGWVDTHGGGVRNRDGSPTFRNLIISGNYAADGGGMYNDNASPTLINVVFQDNTGLWGGGMHNWNASCPALSNVIFEKGSADFGGCMYNNWSDPVVVNTTIFDNDAYAGGGMYNNFGNPVLVNTILWGDEAETEGQEIYNASAAPHISYSLVSGSGGSGDWDPTMGIDGGNNIDVDPLFADESTGDVRLLLGSPAIDAGSNTAPGIQPTDLDGNTRILNGIIDMGAYEFQAAAASAYPSPYVFVEVPIYEMTCDTIYFENNGGETCTIEGIYGCTTEPFSIDTSMTEHTIEPGGTTEIVVCITPEVSLPDTAELVIVSDAWNSPTIVQITIDEVTDAETNDRTPLPFRIVSVSPNPFNPSTTIRFTLPSEMPVTAAVYSVTGARIRALVNGERFRTGENVLEWDGRTDNGSTAASGVYFIRLETRLGAKVTRAVLLR